MNKENKKIDIWDYITIGTLALSGISILTMIGGFTYSSIKRAEKPNDEVASLKLQYDKLLLQNIQNLRNQNDRNYLINAHKQTTQEFRSRNLDVGERVIIHDHAAMRHRQLYSSSGTQVCYRISKPYAIPIGNGLVIDPFDQQGVNPDFENQLRIELGENIQNKTEPRTIQSGHISSEQMIQFHKENNNRTHN